MATPSRRDLAVTALIFGFFGLAWFAWAGAEATKLEEVFFIIGSVLSAIVLLIGVIAAFRLRHVEGAVRDKKTRRRYGIIVGIETALAAVGAAILGGSGHANLIAAWVSIVVGVHFIALAPLFRDWWLIALAVLMAGAGVWAWWYEGRSATPTSTTAAPLSGLLLVVYGFLALVRQANMSGRLTVRRRPRKAATAD